MNAQQSQLRTAGFQPASVLATSAVCSNGTTFAGWKPAVRSGGQS